MREYRPDPSRLEGEALDRWYRRSPAQIRTEREATRRAQYDAFFGAANGTSEAIPDDGMSLGPGSQAQTRSNVIQFAPRGSIPTAPAVVTTGPRPILGAPPANAADRAVETPGSFFETYPAIPNSVLGPAYVTDLPKPLNLVKPRVGDWFELGDGRLVRGADEVERLFIELQLSRSGENKPEPPARVNSADRHRDGAIPRAEQLAKGEREIDPTCHVNGGWEPDPTFSRYKAWTQDYEDQITRAPGLDYVVRNPLEKPVRFDGCAVWDPRRSLLEAKGPGYEALDRRTRKSTFLQFIWDGVRNQARRQNQAARGRTVEWHVAEPAVVPTFREVIEPASSLRVLQTSPRPGAAQPKKK
ncbi:MAG: restriction endonuclease fold toxin 5 domain-containing protein [Phenylobacterium sp.]|nr:restriction endonuclease fold toxin 5 domain-containing protein [Phenylobacterium sp.]